MKIKNLSFSNIYLLLLIVCILGVSSVFSPVMLRVLIDGFLLERDEELIFKGAVIIFFIEVVNLTLSHIFKLMLDKTYNLDIGVTGADGTSDSFDKIKANYFPYINFWYFVKDSVTLFFLLLVTCIISLQIGITTFLFFLFSLFVADIIEKQIRFHKHIYYKSDLPAVKMKCEWKILRLESMHFDIQGVFRVLLLMTILFYGSYQIINNQWDMGVIWSNLFIVFRAQGPIRGIIKGIITSKKQRSEEESLGQE